MFNLYYIMHLPFIPDAVYHIYNHANGKDVLFKESKNYFFFLEKYQKYLAPVVDTFTYCLMPNHFHMMIRVKPENKLIDYYFRKKKLKRKGELLDLPGFRNLEGLVSQQFSNFFNSYAKAFNKTYQRQGALFQKIIKRKAVRDASYYSQLVFYIHHNPVHHGFVDDLKKWKHSSYTELLRKRDTFLCRREVLKWFGNKKTYIQFHTQNHQLVSVFD
ncbi:hypothetical protein AAG747_10750 [Rapidithrix thailandica]|uniref:Transposase IS200-like domain-containing protein n=1 Tax=Rapidithrix thailandica TaxID=413964 RepID=A0AAW9S7N0_9BACT